MLRTKHGAPAMHNFSDDIVRGERMSHHGHNDVTQLQALRNNIARIEMRLDKARRRNEYEKCQHLMRLLNDSQAKAQLIAERIGKASLRR